MGQLDITAGRYRSLRMGAIAGNLVDLLATAEANEASYLTFADMLVEHEQQQRETKRIDLYRRQAKFPSDKRLEAVMPSLAIAAKFSAQYRSLDVIVSRLLD